MSILETPMFDLTETGGYEFSKAADLRSADTKAAVKLAVLELVAEFGSATGKELNHHYANRAEGLGWPTVDYDSPRKRAGELVRDQRLRVLNLDAPRGQAAEYTLLGVRS